MSILLVEDDDVAAEAVVRGLHKHGLNWPVVFAEDGVVALEILRGTHARRIQKPLLAFVDLNMQSMRADPELRGTVAFILTTSAADSDRAKAYQQCIAGYIVKSAVGPQFSGLARFLTEYHSAVVPA